jgi:hypothetical protein
LAALPPTRTMAPAGAGCARIASTCACVSCASNAPTLTAATRVKEPRA